MMPLFAFCCRRADLECTLVTQPDVCAPEVAVRKRKQTAALKIADDSSDDCAIVLHSDAGWSSLAARRAHNPKVTGSNPVPATKSQIKSLDERVQAFAFQASMFQQ